MKKALSVLILFAIILTMCSCDSGTSNEQSPSGASYDKSVLAGTSYDKKAFLGRWALSEGKTNVKSIVFYSDGTCLVADKESGTWNIVDDQLKILGAYGGQFFKYDNFISDYSISNDQLILINPIVDGDYVEGQIVYCKE